MHNPLMPSCVAALIATLGRPRELSRLLDSLAKIERGLGAVIVVDNAASDETRGVVEAAKCPAHLITPDTNVGCGGGLRLAGERAMELLGTRLTHVLILDDDVVLPPEILDVLGAALDRAQADAAYPLVIAEDRLTGWLPGLADRTAHRAAKRRMTPRQFRETMGERPLPLVWSQGICLLVTRRAVETLGFHRDDFWVRGEDLEFSLRITALFRGILVPAVTVQHLPPPAGGEESRNAEYLKHAAMVQNIAYVALRLHHGHRVAWSLAGTLRRFLALWGPRAGLDALRALWRGGILGEPAGRGTGRTFQARFHARQSA